MTRPEVKILGSGTSTGIPIVGCPCEVCKSNNPHDKRLRTSIFITTPNQKHILIDTTPDLRAQLLRENISRLDFAILTHDHADHLHGIDDLRPLSYFEKKDIPLYTHALTGSSIIQRFPYIFKPHPQVIGGGIPQIKLNIVQDFLKPITIEGEKFTFFMLPHGRAQTMGFVYHWQESHFAYVIDCHEIPQDVLSFLKSLKLNHLILDCVTPHPHDTHLSQDRSFDYIHEISPKRASLIHMGHHLSHEKLQIACQNEFDFPVGPTFDGEIIYFPDPA